MSSPHDSFHTSATPGCDQVSPLLPAAALGALGHHEVHVVARHLLDCRYCRADLDRLEDLVDELGWSVEQVIPQPDLRQRVLASLNPPEVRLMRPRWRWAAAIAASLIVMLLAGNLALLLQGNHGRHATPPATAGTIAASSVPQLVWYDMTASGAVAGSAQGILCAQKNGGLAWLIVQDLPAPPPGMAYQVWLTAGDLRVSAGMFTVDPHGRGFLTIKLKRPIESYAQLGVTEEPAGGSPAPTGDRMLSVSLN